MSAQPIAPARLSLGEFLAHPETLTPTELFEGAVIVSPAPSFRHQKLAFHLAKRIEQWAGRGEVAIAPVDVVLSDSTVVQPDLLWIAPDNDRCYERAGVREYWLAEPTTETLEVWTLGEKEYTLVGTYRAPQTFVSPALGHAVPVSEVYPMESPK
ncbi:MAG: Uma2 family endonuclease [Anaerolineae bacterium]|nr:Uma2 family endonuclease [Anaerolineae bacterium]